MSEILTSAIQSMLAANTRANEQLNEQLTDLHQRLGFQPLTSQAAPPAAPVATGNPLPLPADFDTKLQALQQSNDLSVVVAAAVLDNTFWQNVVAHAKNVTVNYDWTPPTATQ